MVKGGPDVVLQRCTHALAGPGQTVQLEDMRADIEAEQERLAEQGLRTLAFATRFLTPADEAALVADPMSYVEELVFVGLVGIVDPLRPTAKVAVEIALKAGIEVRMITGDHAVTASAIGAQLGLGPGAISGPELAAAHRRRAARAAAEPARVRPRHPRGQAPAGAAHAAQGLVVAMTGDAVNDAAAIKQADIGVAMGSGSEVTKQAARLVLTDDNFSTLVHAVELGRSIYQKITAYIRFQMSQLIGLVVLFLAASIFDIADGVAMTPMMVLFLNFFVCVFPVIAIMLDPVGPGIMDRAPRDPDARDQQRPRRAALDPLRLRSCSHRLGDPAGARPGHPGRRPPDRVDDDGVRRHGPRLGAVRAGPAARARVRAWPRRC